MEKSNYTIDFETIDGEKHHFEWDYYSTIDIIIDVFMKPHYPHMTHGINFMENGKFVCIPWHQIKRSAFSEEELT